MSEKTLSNNIKILITADNPDDFSLMYNFTLELFKGMECPYRIDIVPRIITKSYIGLTINAVLTECSIPGNGVIDIVRVTSDGASVLFHSKLKEPILGVTEFQIEFNHKMYNSNASKPDRKFYIG